MVNWIFKHNSVFFRFWGSLTCSPKTITNHYATFAFHSVRFNAQFYTSKDPRTGKEKNELNENDGRLKTIYTVAVVSLLLQVLNIVGEICSKKKLSLPHHDGCRYSRCSSYYYYYHHHHHDHRIAESHSKQTTKNTRFDWRTAIDHSFIRILEKILNLLPRVSCSMP